MGPRFLVAVDIIFEKDTLRRSTTGNSICRISEETLRCSGYSTSNSRGSETEHRPGDRLS
jgi:hypothetical protein